MLSRTPRLFAAGLLVSALKLVAGDMATRVETRSGAVIEAPTLRDTEDSVILDLGFDVLRIPSDHIQSLEMATRSADASQAGASKRSDHLYGERTKLNEDSVASWASRLGEAVVEVRSRSGQGSGFVINEDGYVITNYHVIALDRELNITMFRQEGSELTREQYRDIRIVAMDPVRDLALLKIQDADEKQFSWVPLADSSATDTGQSVFAIGSPLGLDRTVSRGIISLADRYMNGRLLLQTTTQINPGNSGGPLLNLFGEVVGVNTLKVMSTGIEGMCFAVPSNQVKLFLQNRSAFAFDPRSPNAGYHYLNPPRKHPPGKTKDPTP